MVDITDLVFDENGKVVVREDGSLERRDKSTAGSRFATTAANQFAAGFGDELLDLVGAEEAARITRRNQDRLEEESTAGSIAAGALGFLVPGGALAKAVGLGAKGLSTGARMARGAVAGGIEGGFIGAGNADGEGESRTGAALTGAALGVGIGGALPGVGTLFRNIRAGKSVDDAAVQRVADALNTTPDDVKKRVLAGERIDEMAIGTNNGDTRLATESIDRVKALSPEANNSVVDVSNRRLNSVSGELTDTVRSASDDLEVLKRSTVNEANPDEYADALLRQRDEIGEDIGSFRMGTPINAKGGVGELIANSQASIAIRESIEEAMIETAKFTNSRQLLDADGQQIGKVVLLNAADARKKNLESAGIYVEFAGNGKGAKPTYEEPNLNANVLAVASQKLEGTGTGLMDNTAENASKATSLGRAYVDAAQEIKDMIVKDSPEGSEFVNKFIRNDAQKRLFEKTSQILNSTSPTSRAELKKQIINIIDGTNNVFRKGKKEPVPRPNIEPDEIAAAVRNALRKAIDDGAIETFDDTAPAFSTIKTLMERAGAEDEYAQITQALKNRIAVQPAQDAIEAGLESSVRIDKVASTLRKAFDKPAIRKSLEQLPEEQAQGYTSAIDQTIKQIDVLAKIAGTSKEKIIDDPTLLQSALSHLPFSLIVFNTYSKALGVSMLKASRDSKVFQSISKNKKINDRVVSMVRNEPGRLEDSFKRELEKSMNAGGASDDFVRRAVLGAIEGIPESNLSETSNSVEPDFNNNSDGTPFDTGSSEAPKTFTSSGGAGVEPNFSNVAPGTPFN